MKKILSLAALLITCTLIATQCGVGPAEQSSGPEIMIMAPYARASMPNGAVFMTLENRGDSDDVLLSAECDVAGTVELHESKMDENGVMKMSPVPNIPVPAGDSATLKPGGLHVMLLGLNEALAEGDTFSVTLNFEKSGSKTVEVEVRDSLMGQGMDHGENDPDSMSPGGDGEMGLDDDMDHDQE